MDFFSLPRLARAAIRHGLIAKNSEDCRTTAELLAFLSEFEARKMYVEDGYSSMYAYCLGELHFSEDTTGRRLDAARTAGRFPAILVAVAEGRIHLSAVLMLADKLTADTVDELIAAATYKSKSEIALMLAQRYPKPDVPTTVVAVPAPLMPSESGAIVKVSPAPVRVTLAENPAAPSGDLPMPPPRMTPTAPDRYRFEHMLRQSTYELLKRAQDLSPQIPSHDVDQVLHRALELLVAELEKKKFAATDKPRPGSRCPSDDPRHIPADVRREVRKRDGGRCTYVSSSGHRCESRRVEFDHVVPVARGGTATLANLRLRCRAHNQYAADCAFGPGFMNEKRNRSGARRANAHARALEARRAEERAEAAALAKARAECATAEEARAHLDQVWRLLDHAAGSSSTTSTPRRSSP